MNSQNLRSWITRVLLLTVVNSCEAAGWPAYYDGASHGADAPAAITTDTNGNVYVTGRSHNGTNSNYVTIKFDSDGSIVWTAHYAGPGHGDDAATAIAVDGGGNVIVTGTANWNSQVDRDIVTIKYNAEGQQLWLARYDGPEGRSEFRRSDVAVALGSDAAGHIYVTGYSDLDDYLREFVTIKYDASGEGVWTNRFSGPGGSEPTASAVSKAGDVCVTGGSSLVEGVGFDGDCQDYSTVKYDRDGHAAWTNRYHPESISDRSHAAGVALDAEDNVYITGYSGTAKYSSDGDLLWLRPFPGYARFLGIDRLGRVVVAGATGFRDAALVLVVYTVDGSEISRSFASLLYDDNWPIGLAFDGTGNPVVGSESTRTRDEGDTITAMRAVRYGTDGAVHSVRGLSGWSPEYVRPSAITADVAGDIFLAGIHSDAGLQTDIVVLRIAEIPLSIQRVTNSVIVKWSPHGIGAVLESTGRLPYAVWNPVTNSVTVVNGENVVTISIEQGQQFFRVQ